MSKMCNKEVTMINGVSGGSASLMASLQSPAKLQASASGALPEPVSAFEIATQIQDIQAKNLRRSIDAQTLVLDLLV